MKEFVICFYEDTTRTYYDGNGSEGHDIAFKKGELIKVTEKQMFEWLEIAFDIGIKFEIYEIKIVCNLK